MQPVSFAVVGCGMLARGQHLPNILASPKLRLAVCCDVDPATLTQCCEQFGAPRTTTDYHAAIADPAVEAVCLATTEKLRLPVIRAALAAGKAVYCEKPLAQSLPELYEIQRLAQAAGVPFCVGHNRRSAPAMLEARQLFRAHMEQPAVCPWRFDRDAAARPALPADGVAGMSVRINDDWYSWKSWVFDPTQAPHGPLLFEMTHFTDICNWFLAAEPVEVTAVETSLLHHGVLIRYRTGELASVMMCANGTFGYPKELYEMFGNGGAVVVDHLVEVRTAGITDAPARITYPMLNDRHPAIGTEGGISGWLAKKRAACNEAAAAGDPLRQFAAEPDKGHARQLDRFADQIRGVGPEVCSVDDAVLATRVALAAVKSVAEHRPVALAEL